MDQDPDEILNAPLESLRIYVRSWGFTPDVEAELLRLCEPIFDALGRHNASASEKMPDIPYYDLCDPSWSRETQERVKRIALRVSAKTSEVWMSAMVALACDMMQARIIKHMQTQHPDTLLQ